MRSVSSSGLDRDFFSEAGRWISFNTVTHRSNKAFVDYLEARFRPLGFKIKRQQVREKGIAFFNFLAHQGPRSGPPLLLNTHLDTVPPGPAKRWTSTGGRPFHLRIRGNRLFGLGVADVKLNLLCQWEALRRLKGQAFHRPLVLAGTFGEERGLRGVRRLLARWEGPRPALALVGEPSEMRPIDRHRGYLVFEWKIFPSETLRVREKIPLHAVEAEGRSAHSSTPELGVNAVGRALEILERWVKAGLSPRVISLSGGTAPNQVPADAVMRVAFAEEPKTMGTSSFLGAGKKSLVPWRALAAGSKRLSKLFPPSHSVNLGTVRWDGKALSAVFDVRYPPGRSAAGIVRKVKKEWRALCRKTGVSFRLEVRQDDPPLSSAKKSPALSLLKGALKRSGLSTEFQEKLTCTEAGFYDRGGIPALVIGPGRSKGNVHRPNESISVVELEKAVKFYEQLLRAWCLNE
jgi:acetylornithine deacetylase/succinyl-diaminopimelate desuccinylase-like protein